MQMPNADSTQVGPPALRVDWLGNNVKVGTGNGNVGIEGIGTPGVRPVEQTALAGAAASGQGPGPGGRFRSGWWIVPPGRASARIGLAVTISVCV